MAGKEEQDEAESIAKESRKKVEQESEESKKTEDLEKKSQKTNQDRVESTQNDMNNIEKDAEKDVENEFHGTDEQYLNPPNTTKLENEIKRLDIEFGKHVERAVGIIVNRPSNTSNFFASQSDRRKEDFPQGPGIEVLPIIGNRTNDIPRAVESLRTQAATTFLGSEGGVGINMAASEETAIQ